MKHILITGGAGFIGSHLAEYFLKKGDKVRIIDNLFTGREDNFKHLKKFESFSSVIDTVMNIPLMEELINWSDIIFHLAALVGVKLIMENPIKTIEDNIHSTEIVLELASKKNKRLMFTSSSEVYGKLDEKKLNEEDNSLLGPVSFSRWSYAISKIVDELLLKAYFKEKKLKGIIVRLFNVIGPRQTGHYGMVVPRLIEQSLTENRMTVYGNGCQKRSFTWIDDVVTAMDRLMETPQAYGEVFNIGHFKEITIYELAVMIKELTQSSSEIALIPYQEAYEEGFEDVPRRMPDISKIQNLIGYKPEIYLPEMIQRIILEKKGLE